MKLTPEHLASLLTQYSENPLLGVTERDALKQAAEMIGEYSEIKPHLEAEISRLQKERDEAVASRRAAQTREDDLITLRQKDGKDFNIEKSKLLLRIAELEKDKARLDFVLRCLSFTGASLEYDSNIADMDKLKYMFTSTSVYTLDTIYGTGETPIEAIDAAMEAESE